MRAKLSLVSIFVAIAAVVMLASVPADRRGHLQVMLVLLRLNLARLRGDVPVVVEEARRLLEPAGTLAAADDRAATGGCAEAGAASAAGGGEAVCCAESDCDSG